jgi:NitT/TauT family transport system ATP-binding protein
MNVATIVPTMGAQAGADTRTLDERTRGGTPQPALKATDVSFAYGGPRHHAGLVLDRVTVTVAPGEFVALIGANGSGKSTLLRLMAGLLTPDAGAIEIEGRPVHGPDRRVGLVFQEPRLLPWRSTLDNVAFPLELAGEPRLRREARARELIRLVGLRGVDDARPHQLSGGMRQRAAIARALALAPGILLLDEPFSALDALTRERFNVALQAIWRETGTSIVLVTHSIPEAIFLADRVLVLAGRPGRIAGEVGVPLRQPRELAALDTAVVSEAAATIRGLLAADAAAAAGETDDVPAGPYPARSPDR